MLPSDKSKPNPKLQKAVPDKPSSLLPDATTKANPNPQETVPYKPSSPLVPLSRVRRSCFALSPPSWQLPSQQHPDKGETTLHMGNNRAAATAAAAHGVTCTSTM